MAFMKGKGKGMGAAWSGGGKGGERREKSSLGKGSSRKGSFESKGGRGDKGGRGERRKGEGDRGRKEVSGKDLDSQLSKYFGGEGEVKKGSKENISQEKLDSELDKYMARSKDEAKKPTEDKDEGVKADEE